MSDTDLGIVARQYAELTGYTLKPRRANLLANRHGREDETFIGLADRAFDDPGFIERLTRMAGQWLQRCPCETTRAIAAYAAYLRGDFSRAATFLLGCIGDSPRNLDNWVDLAFALNHLGNPLGRDILFNPDEYIERFAASGDRVCTLARLDGIRDAIVADGAAYSEVWGEWFDPAAWQR